MMRGMGWFGKVAVVVAVVIFLGAAAAADLGVYPDEVFLGEVERGDDVSMDVALVGDDFGDNFTVVYYPLEREAFVPRERTYRFDAREASHEGMGDWVDVGTPEVTLGALQQFESGDEYMSANAQASYSVSVPGDAEPGYRLGEVRFRTDWIDGERRSARTAGTHTFAFRVPGDAVRDAVIEGVDGEYVPGTGVRVGMTVRNTGTVTVPVSVDPVVHTEQGEVELGRVGGTLAPNESRTFEAWADRDSVSPGSHLLEAELEWVTDEDRGMHDVVVAAPEPESSVDRWVVFLLAVGLVFFIAVMAARNRS